MYGLRFAKVNSMIQWHGATSFWDDGLLLCLGHSVNRSIVETGNWEAAICFVVILLTQLAKINAAQATALKSFTMLSLMSLMVFASLIYSNISSLIRSVKQLSVEEILVHVLHTADSASVGSQVVFMSCGTCHLNQSARAKKVFGGHSHPKRWHEEHE